MSFRYEILDSKAWLKNLETSEYQETELSNLFQNDILDENHKLISSEIRSSKYLVGTFSTSQTQRFGKNKKGNVIYLVKPLNNKLPGFLISYGGKLKGKLAVKFKYNNWNNKLPSGEIIDVIGNYNQENMVKILMYHHNIYPKKIKTTENQFEELIERKDLTHLNVFSIDPEGCLDIDDALTIEEDGNRVTIGIHIAQPICWLSFSDIKTKMEYQFSTLYIEEDRKDLWGETITNKASLFQGEKKPVYTTLFHYQDTKLVSTQEFPAYIINKNKLTYQNAEVCSDAIKLKEFTKNFRMITDYHEVVSYWMLKTNSHIGRKLKDKIPYRVNHQQDNLDVSLDKLPEDIGNKFLSKKIESAYYSMDEVRHQTLGIDYYCHFTSPIRRIIDTWIHYYLTYPSSREEIEIDCQLINKLDKETKRFHRQLELDVIIGNLFKDKSNLTTKGYISEIKSNNRIEVYIEEIGFWKINLYNLKFDFLVDKKMENDKITLTYQAKDYIYKIGDEIELSLNKVEATLPKDKMLINIKNRILFI